MNNTKTIDVLVKELTEQKRPNKDDVVKVLDTLDDLFRDVRRLNEITDTLEITVNALEALSVLELESDEFREHEDDLTDEYNDLHELLMDLDVQLSDTHDIIVSIWES